MAELIFIPGASTSSVVVENERIALALAAPHHGGPKSERIFSGESTRNSGAFQLVESDKLIAGVAVAPANMPPREAAAFLYEELFRNLGDRQLVRVWNYIPQINELRAGEENYREFNAGRLEAFRRNYGAEFRPRLPAASALGTQAGGLAVAFLAGTETPVHFENPEQVPACDYPPEYGKQPPAFARGTRVRIGDTTHWFLAGTASIKGHLTLGQTCAEQLSLTLDNIRLMQRTMSLPADAKSAWKVFVRRPADIEECRELVTAAYPAANKQTMFVQADICRSELLVEIEAVFVG